MNRSFEGIEPPERTRAGGSARRLAYLRLAPWRWGETTHGNCQLAVPMERVRHPRDRGELPRRAVEPVDVPVARGGGPRPGPCGPPPAARGVRGTPRGPVGRSPDQARPVGAREVRMLDQRILVMMARLVG